MPIIHFYGFARSADKRRALVGGITEAACKAYDVPPEQVTVHIFDVAKDNVAHGGVLACDGGEKTIPPDRPWLISEY